MKANSIALDALIKTYTIGTNEKIVDKATKLLI